MAALLEFRGKVALMTSRRKVETSGQMEWAGMCPARTIGALKPVRRTASCAWQPSTKPQNLPEAAAGQPEAAPQTLSPKRCQEYGNLVGIRGRVGFTVQTGVTESCAEIGISSPLVQQPERDIVKLPGFSHDGLAQETFRP
jgi:hypothetical protein